MNLGTLQLELDLGFLYLKNVYNLSAYIVCHSLVPILILVLNVLLFNTDIKSS